MKFKNLFYSLTLLSVYYVPGIKYWGKQKIQSLLLWSPSNESKEQLYEGSIRGHIVEEETFQVKSKIQIETGKRQSCSTFQ